MRAERIVARGFRNLADLDLGLPAAGAVFLGPNGHGKTNLLELLYYPVLFRSLRGARDAQLVRHGDPGFSVSLSLTDATPRELSAAFRAPGKQKRVAIDGVEPERISEAIGHWLAVAFLPTDLRLVQGPAVGRRQYLDRVLSLADRNYLRALLRYRGALLQRNAALRQGRRELGGAFEGSLAQAGAELVRKRSHWASEAATRFATECELLGELDAATLAYRGDEGLSDPAQWPAALRRAASRDEALGLTTVGPHRHDLELRLGGRPLREVGSTGQQRTAAIALKLCEWETLASALHARPALLLDDVFAELDGPRQERLAARLSGAAPQTFITSPRQDELPEAFHLDTLSVEAGRVSGSLERLVA